MGTNSIRFPPAAAAAAFLLLFLSLSGEVLSLGINYGQIANNLPTPEKAVALVKSIGASKVKLYDADPKVLKAFAKSGVEMMVCLGNEYLSEMARDEKAALDWVKKNVQAYLPDTNISCVLIGNEVLSYNDTTLTSSLLPAMQNIHSALQNLGLDRQVSVTTAHNLAILQTSYPPSAGAFRQDLVPCLSQILSFHAKTGSPFLINAYPYFAYKADPKQVQLDFVLFQSQSQSQSQSDQAVVVDPATGLRYNNMLFAQIDAVYSAMGPTYSKKVQVQVSETGWPSKGDDDEAGATPDNAKKYNGNLIKLISQSQTAKGRGTPMRPECDLNIFLFALFNENMKPGPTSERNYGLFKPDGTPAYTLGLSNIQAVGNLTSSTTPAATPSSDDSPSDDSPSSTGYLSISGAEEMHPPVGLPLIGSALLILMVIVI